MIKFNLDLTVKLRKFQFVKCDVDLLKDKTSTITT